MASTAPSTPTSRRSTTIATTSPTELVAAWKKEGLFDALRKQFIHDFSQSDDKDTLLKQLDERLTDLVASPSFAQLNKKDRLLHLYNSIEQRSQLLQQTSAATNQRLRAKQDGQSESSLDRVERGLRTTLRSLRGESAVVEDESNDASTDKMDVEEGPNGLTEPEHAKEASKDSASPPIAKSDTAADTKMTEQVEATLSGSPRIADP